MTLEDRIMNLVERYGKGRNILIVVTTEEEDGYSCALTSESPEEAVGLCSAAVTYTGQLLDVQASEICKAILSVLKSSSPVTSQELN